MKSVFESPFYILGASPRDDRRALMDKADERALLSDAEAVGRARAALMDPRERLAAELRWFSGASDDDVAKILDWLREIEAGDGGHGPGASALGRVASLNVALWAFASRRLEGPEFSILHISRMFERLDEAVVRSELDADRDASGFPRVALGAELDDALRDHRKDIVSVLIDKISGLDLRGYTTLATRFAEKYAEKGGAYEGHVLLGDIVDAYELHVASDREEQTHKIISMTELIQRDDQDASVGEIELLVGDIGWWGVLTRPSCLVARARGLEHPTLHEEAEEILPVVRSLALALCNEHSREEDAWGLTIAMKDAFAGFSPRYAVMLDEDIDALDRLIERKRAAERMRAEKEVARRERRRRRGPSGRRRKPRHVGVRKKRSNVVNERRPNERRGRPRSVRGRKKRPSSANARRPRRKTSCVVKGRRTRAAEPMRRASTS